MKKNKTTTHDELVEEFLDLLDKHKDLVSPQVGIFVLVKTLTDIAIHSAPNILNALGLIQQAISESVNQHNEEK